jgi:hypothetical protein
VSLPAPSPNVSRPASAKPEPARTAISPTADSNTSSAKQNAEPSASVRPPERKVQTPPRQRSDWFSNQGKFIAIGFVLALIGTIYLARSNRGSGPTKVAQPNAHPGEAGQQIAASNATPATVVGKDKDESPADAAANKPAEASPARFADVSTDQPSQADLHPPTIPQLVREPSNSSQPDNSALFPWTEQPGDRLATRPTESQAAASPPAQPKYPVTPANAPLSQSYPVTSATSPNFAPAPQQPTPAAPDYRSPYIQAPPAGGPPPDGQNFVPPGGAASSYLPPDNSARGYRYERTGSGPY